MFICQKETRKKFLISSILLILALLLFSKSHPVAAAEAKAYYIKVNRYHNTVTVYEKGPSGEFDQPIKAMVCSVGVKATPTRTGVFNTMEKYRWKLLNGDVWGQYTTRIVGGYLFHSVYYYGEKNPATLSTTQYNKLGQPASQGCIRLTVADAKWIYENCKIGTTVEIFDDPTSPGPLGKPEAIKLASNVRWDPTDDNENNPYYAKMPQIKGAKSKVIPWGQKIDLSEGIKAISSVGLDITEDLVISGKVGVYTPGKYPITYEITDKLGRTTTKKITIKVDESKEKPVITGVVNKKIVAPNTVINDTFARKGITATLEGVKLSKKYTTITISQISDLEYRIKYVVAVGKKAKTTMYTKVLIDNEAPVISGKQVVNISREQNIDRALIMSRVKIKDNYSKFANIKLQYSIDQISDDEYKVTYYATDEMKNKSTYQITFVYPKDEIDENKNQENENTTVEDKNKTPDKETPVEDKNKTPDKETTVEDKNKSKDKETIVDDKKESNEDKVIED